MFFDDMQGLIRVLIFGVLGYVALVFYKKCRATRGHARVYCVNRAAIFYYVAKCALI